MDVISSSFERLWEKLKFENVFLSISTPNKREKNEIYYMHLLITNRYAYFIQNRINIDYYGIKFWYLNFIFILLLIFIFPYFTIKCLIARNLMDKTLSHPCLLKVSNLYYERYRCCRWGYHDLAIFSWRAVYCCWPSWFSRQWDIENTLKNDASNRYYETEYLKIA